MEAVNMIRHQPWEVAKYMGKVSKKSQILTPKGKKSLGALKTFLAKKAVSNAPFAFDPKLHDAASECLSLSFVNKEEEDEKEEGSDEEEKKAEPKVFSKTEHSAMQREREEAEEMYQKLSDQHIGATTRGTSEVIVAVTEEHGF